jgi:hypothetical protein
MKSGFGAVKIALDELRMQMLGTQVLFGFQFHGLFQARLDSPTELQRAASCAGLAAILLTIGLLIAVPSHHRLAEHGETTARFRSRANVYAELALATLAVGLACNVFLVTDVQWTETAAVYAGGAVLVSCALAWFAAGLLIRGVIARGRTTAMPKHELPPTPLHEKIDYLLTEARVVLPGAQALLGFDLVVVLTSAFVSLPIEARIAHFVALGCVTLAVLLLISPAAIHRLAFAGDTDERFLRIGSRVVSIALIPLALGIAADIFVATVKLFERLSAGYAAAGGTLLVLLALWYVIPLSLRTAK